MENTGFKFESRIFYFIHSQSSSEADGAVAMWTFSFHFIKIGIRHLFFIPPPASALHRVWS